MLGKEEVSFGSSVRDVGRIGIEVVFLGIELSTEEVAYIGVFLDFAIAVLLSGASREAARSGGRRARGHLSAFHSAESIREPGKVRETEFPGESR